MALTAADMPLKTYNNNDNMNNVGPKLSQSPMNHYHHTKNASTHTHIQMYTQTPHSRIYTNARFIHTTSSQLTKQSM